MRGGAAFSYPLAIDMNTPATAAPSPWIVGPRFDLAFFIGSGLLGFLIMGIHAAIPTSMTLLLCALVSICLDQVHVFHTVTRTYCDRRELRRAPRFYLMVPIVVLAIFAGVAALGLHYALSLVLYAALWHQAKQHYGFVRIYDRRRMASRLGRWDSWLDNFCLFGGIYAPILYVFRLPHLGELQKPLVYPHIPEDVAVAAMSLVGIGFLAMFLREIYRYVRFRQVAIQKVLVISMAAALVFGAAWLETRLIMILVAVTSFHAVQYIAILWLFNRNKYAEGFDRDNAYTSTLVKRRWVWMYFGLGIIYGTITASMQRVDLLVPVAYSLAGVHFVVDARLWKVKYCGDDLRAFVRAPA